MPGSRLEASLARAKPGAQYEFGRLGYYIAASEESTAEHLVFNRTVTLRDTWARVRQAEKQ